MKILIVEDNTQKLRTVQEILEQNFIDYYEVAGCGREIGRASCRERV